MSPDRLVADTPGAAGKAAPSGKSYRFSSSERCNMCKSSKKDQVFIGRRLDRPQGLWPRWKPGITTSIFRCRVCALTYPNPMPLPESPAQHYDVNPEDYWAQSYFDMVPNLHDYQVGTFRRLTGRDSRGSVALDIGAGIGKAMSTLERAGFDTYGIEPSASFRRAAIERFKVPEDRLLLSSVEEAEYQVETFDLINFTAVLEHIPDPSAILRKTIRWLKPGGVMVVDVPSSAFLLSRMVRIFYRLTGNDFVVNTCPMHVPYHLYEFGVESFLRNGRLGGYSVIHVDTIPGAGYMPSVLVPAFNKVMRWTDTGMQWLVWLGKNV